MVPAQRPGQRPDAHGPAWHDAAVPCSPVVAPIQVFGLPDSSATRAAQRYFRERRIPLHQVDLRKRAIAPGELRRFAERLGVRRLADTDGRAWRDAGLGYLRMDDVELFERLLRDPRLLRLPLVRYGNVLAAGHDEEAWRSAADAARADGTRR
jgi:arsenate reductase (glutaredoxin)